MPGYVIPVVRLMKLMPVGDVPVPFVDTVPETVTCAGGVGIVVSVVVAVVVLVAVFVRVSV